MATFEYAQAVNQHYGRQDLSSAILTGLQAAGKDLNKLTYQDLAGVDQFHIGGIEATLKFAARVGLRNDSVVLDIGDGLGGPARTLAAELGCRVTVLDITEEYCQIGEMLTERVGLTDRVAFKQGSALEIPFPDGNFEIVWTQHSSMNIADKERLYNEIHRVLKPSGRFALYEIMAGAVQPIVFPVPWAANPTISFLRPAEAIRNLITETGFRELTWVDVSKPSLEWYRQRVPASGNAAPPPLGLHLLLGENFAPSLKNQILNLTEDRVAVIEAVFERT